MTLRPSFNRQSDAAGWRYGLGYRTRKVYLAGAALSEWELERWNGEDFEPVGTAPSYDAIRTLADEDTTRRIAARRTT